ncbi:MAG: PIF1 family DEAD/DEAH box helicase [bacterium]|nr:PIF1 family DEAD/DEAH box helicase [bacterium]
MTQAQALNILKTGANVYLTGAAGSGKTFVLNQYAKYLKKERVRLAITASTGIAATHIGGLTIHSWSGIGILDYLTPQDIEALREKEHIWKRLNSAQVLIIDEVSMLSPKLFDGLNALTQAVRENSAPFGGLQVVLSGDFFQLPPITRGGPSPLLPEARSWSESNIISCYLTEQYRHKDPALLNILNEIRAGSVSENSRELLAAATDASIFDESPTRLYTHNADVDAINEEELSQLKARAKSYLMKTKGRSNIVATLKRGVLAPEELVLKEGAVVMFVRNGFDRGYVNGTMGIVEDCGEQYPVVRTYEGKRIVAEPVEWAVEEDGKVKASVTQVPLRLAWAITVHKSQGMSLDCAEIDLSKAFVPGQGYVALSRVRTLAGLLLTGLNEEGLRVDERVRYLDELLQTQSDAHTVRILRHSKASLKKIHGAFLARLDSSRVDS